MLTYWLMFLIPAFIALYQKPMPLPIPKKWPILWWIAFIVIALLVGLRYEVGADWNNYLQNYLNYSFYEADDSFKDPSFKFLNYLARVTGGGIILVNAISGLIFTWGLVIFCRTQPRPWLAFTVAIPYLVIVVAMGYTRQSVAIGLVMVAIAALIEMRIYRYFIFMALAVTFHKSAIIVLPLVALISTDSRWIKMLLLLVTAVTLYWLLVRDATDNLVENYITAEYNSSGAAIRVAMNAVPAGLFLLFRKRFRLAKEENGFWMMLSIAALLLVGILLVSPSSTAVDRIALYWIPLQLFVFSRLPEAMGKPGKTNSTWTFLIVLYYAAVLGVWLIFANHSVYWLPYNFYPWDMFWDIETTFENNRWDYEHER